MIILISPAKKMQDVRDFDKYQSTAIRFPKESEQLINRLRTFNPNELSKLMKINPKLAELNHQRYVTWTRNISVQSGSPALLAFNGDVYRGIKAADFTSDELKFAQQHLRILSGLYGILRPMDLILPYRLEMGTRMNISNSKNLYEFWSRQLTKTIKRDLKLHKEKVIINLASNEYSKAIDFTKIDAEVITPNFKEFKDGAYKFYSVFGKYARGLMVSYIIKNSLETADQIKLFDRDAYFFNEQLSESNSWIFTREYGKKV